MHKAQHEIEGSAGKDREVEVAAGASAAKAAEQPSSEVEGFSATPGAAAAGKSEVSPAAVMGEPAPVLEAVEGETHVPDVVVITGMSGAGRTEAMHTFEDLGYYVIDNLPPSMLLSLANMVGINSGIGRHLAVVCDLRSQGLFDELLQEIDKLAEHEISCALLFLDASDEVLRRRYTLTRRRNPIAQEGEATIDAVRRERHALEEVRHRADVVIDTSNLRTIELRRRLETIFSELTAQQMLEVHVFSFGFKYGMPVEADLLIDVRFLPNPYWDPAMRTLTGMDDPVMSFVLGRPETQGFLQAWYALLDSVMPGYVAEGKSTLSIGVGCSGGQHRSVVLARATAQYLRDAGYHVTEDHRDLPRAANVTPLASASAAIPADASGYTPPAVRGAEALGASQEAPRG